MIFSTFGRNKSYRPEWSFGYKLRHYFPEMQKKVARARVTRVAQVTAYRGAETWVWGLYYAISEGG